jgi:hypothetical protein
MSGAATGACLPSATISVGGTIYDRGIELS